MASPSLIQLEFEEQELFNSAWPLSPEEHADRISDLDWAFEDEIDELLFERDEDPDDYRRDL